MPRRPPNCSLAEEAREALRRHVLEPLLPRCMDREYGGFLVDFDERWRAVGPHTKSLEHAARTTSSFALLDAAFPGLGCDRIVRHGCEFLKEMMWDKVHGGFFAQVERAGRPQLDGLKHPHGVTYAGCAFLLAEPYLDRGEGLAWAKRALGWLEDVSWDHDHGGYWGSFHRDNERYATGARLPTADGRDILGFTPGFKEVNTLSDAIEMLILFAAREVEKRCSERLAELIDLVVNRLVDTNGIMPYLWWPDWRPAPDLVRVGYQFATARRMLEASRRMDSAGVVVAKARKLVNFCMASARHPSGGFCYAVTADGRSWPATSPSTDLRQWWVQFEALHALHLLARHPQVEPEGRAEYRLAGDQQWTFVRESFFDRRYQGIRELPLESTPWWPRFSTWLTQQSNPTSVRKTHSWKDPLHEVQTFLALAAN
jgi:mannobiose 2-epimerase